MTLGVGARKEGGTESIRVERHPVNSNHHPALSHCMKIQWKWIEGRGTWGGTARKLAKARTQLIAQNPDVSQKPARYKGQSLSLSRCPTAEMTTMEKTTACIVLILGKVCIRA